MNVVLDIIVILIIVGTVISCRRKGLVRSLAEIIGLFAAIVVSFSLCGTVGSVINKNFVTPAFTNNAAGHIAEILNQKTDGAPVEAIKDMDINTLLADAPAPFLKLLDRYNVNLDEVKNTVLDKVEHEGETVADAVVHAIIDPFAHVLSLFIAFLIIFVICIIIVNLLSRLLKGVSYIPVLGRINRITGALFGLVKGLIIVFLLAAVLRTVLPYLTSGENPVAEADTVEKTIVYKYMDAYNPLSWVLLN